MFYSCAGTNLIVAEKFFCRVRPSTFFSFSRFGERFRDGQHKLVSLLFSVLLLTVPPCPAICKNGGTWTPCPMDGSRRLRCFVTPRNDFIMIILLPVRSSDLSFYFCSRLVRYYRVINKLCYIVLKPAEWFIFFVKLNVCYNTVNRCLICYAGPNLWRQLLCVNRRSQIRWMLSALLLQCLELHSQPSVRR